MRFPRKLLLLLPAVILAAGCAAHVRYYDGYYHDYHSWNNHEVVMYGQWEHDTHRNHVNFGHRDKADQDAYWKWRHDHH